MEPYAIGNRIIIFDGICNFCNGAVNFVLSHDETNTFMFAANQSDAGRKLLGQFGLNPDTIETVYLIEDGQLYDKSTAGLRIVRNLPFPWSLGAVLLIVPRVLRDAVYGVIARNRYRWFGQKESCRIPTPAEKARFLA